MPVDKSNVMSLVARRAIVAFATSGVIVLVFLVLSLMTHSLYALAISSASAIIVALASVKRITSWKLVACSSVVFFSLSILGISLEFEYALDGIARVMAFGSISLLLISSFLTFFMVISPIWNSSVGHRLDPVNDDRR